MKEKPSVKEWADGLRAIADWAEAHPELMGRVDGQRIFVPSVNGLDDKQAATVWADVLPRPVTKDYSDELMKIHSAFGPHVLGYVAWRKAVCQRRVVGTKITTTHEPDPDAVAALPTVAVTREVEIVEWDCGDSLLSAGSDS